MTDALLVWLAATAVGVAALPVAALLFSRLPGAGLTLARPLGLLLVAYPAWLLASVRVAPYGVPTIALGLVLLGVLGALLAPRALAELRRPAARRLWLAGEAVFTSAFAGWTLLRAFAPDVWNTEKPMDMAFLNAINRSDWFPPHDPWLAGADVNYYYFGHYVVALLVRVTGVPPEVGFNLALALVAALVSGAVFAVAGTLSLVRGVPSGRPVVHGLVAVGVTVALGNLAGATGLLTDRRPAAEYDWWSPSRVIEGTANEFPFFSFLLGDLHAHVMVTPFALLFLAVVLQLAVAGPGLGPRAVAVGELLLGALVLGSLYAVNTLDFLTALALLGGGLALWLVADRPRGARAAVAWSAALPVLALVLFAPFVLTFSPASEGVALVREHASFTRFAADVALIYALPLCVLAIALARRLTLPLRYLAWAGTALLVVLVLLAPERLAGLFLLLLVAAVALHAALDPRLAQAERFFWLLAAAGLGLVAVGEFAYVRDVFEGTASYRFNTVFKAGYQAWYLLSLAAAAGLCWAAGRLSARRLWAWRGSVAALVALLGVYPVVGTYARNAGFSRSPTLDGLGWLKQDAPGDADAVAWLRESVTGTPVVLEAVGPDYSPEGHARVSTFTGLPTVIGWTGHVVQWGHDPGNRAADVDAIYATRDALRARALLTRYDVRYVVVGSLERGRYGRRSLAKFERIGRPVFRSRGTTVYAVSA